MYNKIILDLDEDYEDRVLVYKAQCGGPEEMEKFIQYMEGFVRKVIYQDIDIRSYLNRGVDYDDLMQSGRIGLVNGVKKYDFRKGVKVRTYLSLCIKYEIKNEYRTYGTINVSREILHICNIVLKDLEVKDGKVNYDKLFKLASEAGVKEEKAIDAAKFMVNKCKIYELNSDGYVEYIDHKCYEKLGSYHINRFEEEEDDFFKLKEIREQLKKLTRIEQIVVHELFTNDKSQTQIARELGYSPSAISRIKKKALKKLKDNIL